MGWVAPLSTGIDGVLVWLYGAHQPEYLQMGDSGFDLQMSYGFLNIGLLWLGIVMAFWAFVAACKLWPIKKKNEK